MKEIQQYQQRNLKYSLQPVSYTHLYRCILENAKDYLRKNGAIFLEIGYDQKEKIEEILKSYKIYKETKCIKDFGGNNRVIIIKR